LCVLSFSAGVTALTDAISSNGALTKLILKDNAMLTKAAGKALASALASNSVLTELDISDQAGYEHDDGPGFANELAAGISDNGALTALDMSNNSIVTAAYIKAPRKGIKIGELIDGNPVIEEEDSDGEVRIRQLDGSRAIASAIPDMGAMTSLNLASNSLGVEGAKIVAAFLPKCT
jgi:hypothetical protein